jgi:beta-lactamase regulating signal transducer with metallopeptidase domain
MTELVTVASLVFKTSLIVVATGLLSLALRSQAAAFSHVLWTAALALCVLMPVALLLPSHEIIALRSAPTLPLLRAQEREWEGAIVAVWVIGSCAVLLRELVTTIALERWRRHASPLASARWSATLVRVSTAHGFDLRRLRVLESEHVASPCTWGVLRPTLLLPTAGDAWPESAREAALMHEIAHIERRDAASILVARIACALHWYNPLVWLAAERIRSLQERACDDAVLRAGTKPSDYAQFLLDVAAHPSRATTLGRATIGMTQGSSLRARIVTILDPQVTRSHPKRIRVVAACSSLFALTILLATATVAVEPPPLPPIPLTPELPELPEIPELPVPPALPVPPVPPVPVTSP